jgi:hypothetical protein
MVCGDGDYGKIGCRKFEPRRPIKSMISHGWNKLVTPSDRDVHLSPDLTPEQAVGVFGRDDRAIVTRWHRAAAGAVFELP